METPFIVIYKNGNMGKPALKFGHSSKERMLSDMDVIRQEPWSKDNVFLSKGGGIGPGWEYNSLSATGSDRLLSFRKYEIREPSEFKSEISEPVICLSIRCGYKGKIGFPEALSDPYFEERENFLFWTCERKVERYLSKGEHVQVDLFIRPEALYHLEHIEVIKAIIEQSTLGEYYLFELGRDGRVDNFLLEFLNELEEKPPATARFSYLCDCLLLLYLGETIDDLSFSPVKDGEVLKSIKNVGKQRHFLPTYAQHEIIMDLQGKSNEKLVQKFWSCYALVDKKKDAWEREIALAKEVRKCTDAILGDTKKELAKLYIKITKILQEALDKFEMDKKERHIIRRSILRAFKLSFYLQRPDNEDLTFYYSCMGDPFSFDDEEFNLVSDVEFALYDSIPAYFVIPDNISEYRACYNQRAVGGNFKKSPIFGDQESISIEVTQLYSDLMEHFLASLDFGEDMCIATNEIIMELDSAYESDDLISLLQIEIEYFAADRRYIELQKDDRLKWFIVALCAEDDMLDAALDELKMDSKYEDLQKYHALRKNMSRFKNTIEKQRSSLNNRLTLFAIKLRGVPEILSFEQISDLAMTILSLKR